MTSPGTMPTPLHITSVVEDLLHQVKLEGKVTDELLLAFHEIFQHTLDAALDILDRSSVVMVVAQPSGRSFFLFEGTKGASYLCTGHYCSCPSFTFSVLSRSESLLCKHQLAARLVDAGTAKCKRKDIDDAEYVELVCGVE